ncbi:hypothetical protein [Gluconacetobacter dulcium]|uniref:hypothetical protein n=1 Tax=Gluconacetobacter dulcium TaxID=2729096 RepID=UPI001C805E8E|nr:hypothetical protein [Gluconacetobacter dulcium]
MSAEDLKLTLDGMSARKRHAEAATVLAPRKWAWRARLRPVGFCAPRIGRHGGKSCVDTKKGAH